MKGKRLLRRFPAVEDAWLTFGCGMNGPGLIHRTYTIAQCSLQSQKTAARTEDARKMQPVTASITGGFAGAAVVVAALEPAVADQDGFDTGDDRGLGFLNVVAGLLE